MKTKEERNVLKGEVEALNKKLAELPEEEMKQVSGGTVVSNMPERDERQGWIASGFPADGITAADAPDWVKCDLDISDSDITDTPRKN